MKESLTRFNPGWIQFKRWRNGVALPDNKRGNIKLITDLSQALNFPPFNNSNQTNQPVVICDLDGVISDPWNNNPEANLRRLLSVRQIIKTSAEFHLWSMRVPVDDESIFWLLLKPIFDGGVSRYPFLTDTSLRRLWRFFQKANPRCLIELHPGIKKFGDSDNFSLKKLLKF